MEQQEFLYDYASIAITVTLFLLIISFNEIGFRIGRFVQDRTDTEIKTLTGSIQASILGLLALLLGFTFSMSMQRYDNRSQALISEANTIGTAILRVQLLPAEYQNIFVQKLVTIRGVGENELVWVVKNELERLPGKSREFFRNPSTA